MLVALFVYLFVSLFIGAIFAAFRERWGNPENPRAVLIAAFVIGLLWPAALVGALLVELKLVKPAKGVD